MVWLDICDEQGNAIYFDIHHVERSRRGRRWQHSVNGTCGNGLFEMEVLVEPSGAGEVTFVDLSGGAASRCHLLAGVEIGCLESGLIDAARIHCGLPVCVDATTSPHPPRPRGWQVNEEAPVWGAVN